MGWEKREVEAGNLVILGDEDQQVKRAAGLFVAIKANPVPSYKNPVYELVQKSGDSILVAGSASTERQLFETDIGKFVKLEFLGWGKSNNGKFKMIEVHVWNDEPTEDMKKWPRYDEFANKPVAVAAGDKNDFSQKSKAQEPEDDDLPF